MSFIVRDYPSSIALFGIVNFTGWWFSSVSQEVPEPYLDEFFHIPQAQKYCRGDYSWDPKITTPPGLYLVSRFLQPLIGCEIGSLRFLNSVVLCAVVPLCYGILRTQRARQSSSQDDHQDGKKPKQPSGKQDQTQLIDAHSALNIGLFPPLFFFAALYYTDVLSTMLVLCTYGSRLRSHPKSRSVAGMILTATIGFVALWFRQTNIFWVAICPAGLDVIESFKDDREAVVCSDRDSYQVLRQSWSGAKIYDCAIQDAGPRDYALFVLSLLMAITRKPILAIQIVAQYVVLVALFAGFVVWNGSVVLGDKSAHTATIHIPQMLYIWPYITFFSLPLLIGPILRPIVPFLPTKLQSMCKEDLNAHGISVLPTPLVSGVLLMSSLTAVHFNTIIHPYTLADNRHYVFYVFRILRRHPAMKYLAVPAYCVCLWLAIQALESPARTKDGAKSKRNNRAISNGADHRPQLSFFVIWTATTALSVITAPLVEPRYLIVPWIIWRLHVPFTSASLSRYPSNNNMVYDKRLILESVWLLAINAAVTYTFLFRTFSWPSEPDNKQRFIW